MNFSTALVMIARNESRCIARALHSLRPWVDRMVVLDTGSDDDTVAIARAAGAEVHTTTWPDDFAAARNEALALAGADWHIVVDADEWLASGERDDNDVGAALAALRHTPPTFVGSIEVCSHFDDGDRQGSAPSWLPRVLPGAVRYSGRIHEQPVHTLPTRRLPLRLQHDGYLDAMLAAKGNRNQLLLWQALEAQPEDPYLLYQLGKDHEAHARYPQACAAYLDALPRCPVTVGWRHDLVIRSLFVLKQADRLPEAIQLANAELARWPHSADFHFALGDVLLSHALTLPAAQAEDLLPMIEACWLHCISLGDTLHLEGAVEGRGSHLAAHNLAVFHDTLGHADEARTWRARSRPGIGLARDAARPARTLTATAPEPA